MHQATDSPDSLDMTLVPAPWVCTKQDNGSDPSRRQQSKESNTPTTANDAHDDSPISHQRSSHRQRGSHRQLGFHC